ncbi:MAG: NADH-quinone oxidoreductase subunit NuoF [Candidatus Aminicenantales bacterium]
MNQHSQRLNLMVCGGTSCVSQHSFELKQVLEDELHNKGLKDEIQVVTTGCLGFCEACPLMVVKPDDIIYAHLKLKDIPYLVEEHFLKGRPVKRLMYTPPGDGTGITKLSEIGFFRKQILIALRNRGLIDPEKIEDYIARDGYKGLTNALSEMTPDEIIQEVKRSGLRGRGGAGFPTGLKWEYVRNAEGDPKYLICNGDEGDPGAYMDRSIVEGDPHSVLEGMIIGGVAMGIHQGIVYIRNEYPLAFHRINVAIEQAREYGLLGRDILGSGFDFDVKVVRGAGAFVCGEETSLIASIEGRLAEPRPRPPFPAQSGLWGKPTNINNVETWANVPVIIDRGAAWFSSIGTELSKGTKIFSVVGKVKTTGLVEVPMGLSLGEIIFDICGGIAGDRKFKAVQIGGPSGGCIPASLLDLPVDYEKLTAAGAMMGSGGMVVMDEKSCMVDLAHFFLTFIKDESCGKCLPCREGVPRMLEVLTKIKEGRGEMSDLELLEEISAVVKETSLCGLGKTAANPVISTLRYFREEYESHIKHKKCEAGVCTHLVTSPCQNACPIGTETSSFVAFIAQGKFKEALEVNRLSNPLTSVCGRVCHHPCETACRAGDTDEPIAIRGLKRFVADQGRTNGGRPHVKAVPKQYEKVAVVGSGPAGLMAGWELGKAGYNVTIFEAEAVPGGMLAWGIPEYRLPKNILQDEIDDIKALGIEIRLNTRIGRDLTRDDIFAKGYKAIFLATGAPRNLKLGIRGEDYVGVIDPLEFLKSFNLEKKADIGRKVAVVGGGNTAVDVARTAKRLGADVTILYRRTMNEMPAIQEEIEEALAEGVNLNCLALPVEAFSENGRLQKVKCQRMTLQGFDRSGRPRPVPLEDQVFELEVDTLVPAIGQVPELSFLNGKTSLRLTPHKTLEVNPETMATNVPGIFAGGDVVTGPATVLEAMRAGKIAAESIHRYLRGMSLERDYAVQEMGFEVPAVEIDPDEAFSLTRPRMPVLSMRERNRNFKEVELGYSQQEAIDEARRCLRCDLESIRSRGGIKWSDKKSTSAIFT